MAARSRSSGLPPEPPSGPSGRPRERPRLLPRADVAALWRLHALPPRRRRRRSPAATATPAAPCLDTPRRRAPPRLARSPSRSSSSSGGRPSERKRARHTPVVAASPSTVENKRAQEEEEEEEEAARHPNNGRETRRPPPPPPPPLPRDVMVLVLGDVAALCPRSAFGCRLVSRGWREAATDPTVQAIVWRRCIGEGDSERGSGVIPNGDVGGVDATVGGGCGGAGYDVEGGGGFRIDVAGALARVERDIVSGGDRGAGGEGDSAAGATTRSWGGRPDRVEGATAEGGSDSDSDSDDGAAVRLCAARRWWRAAETLVRLCGAVDRRLSSSNPLDTGEDEVLDSAVDAGDESLCLALLQSPRTAVGMSDRWPVNAPASTYRDEGSAGNRRDERWHSVEALRAGRVELAAALVRPRDDGGGGQHPMALLMALCTGDVAWTEGVRPVLSSAERGVTARLDSAYEMYKRARAWESSQSTCDSHGDVSAAFSIHRSLQEELVNCFRALISLENPEASDELQVVLSRLKLFINLWAHA